MTTTAPVVPPTHKHVILFLAANPVETDHLALGREARAIQRELERSDHRNCFEFETRWAAEPADLISELIKLKPTVVHFSGHAAGGTSDHRTPTRAATRDVALPGASPGPVQGGLYFQAPDGGAQLVTTAALAETFAAVESSVQLVVLNACYTESQADALLAHVDCVVGMSGSIDDNAAKSFASGFYAGIGARQSFAAAYRQGRARVSLEGLPDADRPQLRVRDGIDADHVVLAWDQVEATVSTATVPPARREVDGISPIRKVATTSRVALAFAVAVIPIALLAGRAWLHRDFAAEALQLRKEGWELLARLDTEHAVGRLQLSLGKDPDASLSHAALAVALAAHGNYEAAQEASRNALDRGRQLVGRDRTWVEGVAREVQWELSKATDAYRAIWLSSHLTDRDAGVRLAHVLTLSGAEAQALVTLARIPPPASDDDVRVEYERAMAARAAGTFLEQVKFLDDIVKRNLKHPRVEAVAQWQRCAALHKAGKPTSIAACERAHDLFANAGDQLGQARALAVEATIIAAGLDGNGTSDPERLREAKRVIDKACSLAEGRHSQLDQAGALQNRANILRRLAPTEPGAEDAARDDESAALKLYQSIGNARAAAALRNNQGLRQMDRYEHREALESFRVAQQQLERSGARGEEGATGANIGRMHFLLGDLGEAETSLVRALQIAAEQGQHDYLLDALIDLGSVYMAQGKLCPAARCFAGLQCYLPESHESLIDMGEHARWESSVLELEGGCNSAPRSPALQPRARHTAAPRAQESAEDQAHAAAQRDDIRARTLLAEATEDIARNRIPQGKKKALEAKETARAAIVRVSGDRRLEISLLVTEARAEGLVRNFKAATALLEGASNNATTYQLGGEELEVQLASATIAQISGPPEMARRLAGEIRDDAHRKGFQLVERKADALIRK